MFSLFKKNDNVKDTLSAYINGKLNLPGDPDYIYTVISKHNPADMLIITSYCQRWSENYSQHNWHINDPIVLNAFHRSSPFFWDENISLISELQLTSIFSGAETKTAANGLTLVLHDHMNNLSLLSIVIKNQNRTELESHLSRELNRMQMLLIEINAQMYLISKSVTTQSFRPIFTRRENEILYWASRGKTYAETALILGISVSTVKFHMSNVVDKLGASNARQAIRLSAELNLITHLN